MECLRRAADSFWVILNGVSALLSRVGIADDDDDWGDNHDPFLDP